ncbi:MAG: hypothetical protein ACI4SF_12770 [Oscillospiraceae bacterium]
MSFDDGFILGLSLGGGVGGGSDIYITDYSDTNLTITTIADRSAETPKTTDYTFMFTTQEFKIVTTATSSTKKSTRTWRKTIITSVINDEGVVIWNLTPDTSGKIIAVYDINGNEILNGITNGDSVITDTPEGAALGYALAYNKENIEQLEELIEAYEDGIDDEEEIGDDGETTVETIDFKGSGAVLKIYNTKGLLTDIYYGDYGIFRNVTDNQFSVYFAYHHHTTYATVNMIFNGEYKQVGDVLEDKDIDSSIAYTHYVPTNDTLRLYFGDWFYEDGTPAVTDGITDL